MTLSDSRPINSNFRFFNLSDRLALKIGNYRITRDGGLDIIGDKNGMQIIVQAKSNWNFCCNNNINIQELKNITSTKRKIIICHFNELEGYIKQIVQEHIIEMLKLSNDIYNAKDCIEDPNSMIKDLKNNLTILMSHLEKFGDIKNILTCNTKKYNNIKDLNKALKNLDF
ncbi:45560_t:CDS:2 [Gigaspora margarita]|uniref:45560_t:CDS:1 n=1 Tax=Gigaspora margarita TaxID=4874 RepID=A0ABM8W683_GIGMA|nr:45560_t:CDS:2 [Gigaspora margarita]